jgi:hypothetical protein
MPPKVEKPSKKTELKKKDKIVEVSRLSLRGFDFFDTTVVVLNGENSNDSQ